MKKKKHTCSDCIHEYACQAWNIGRIHDMDATCCENYETVKESPAYFIGYEDGRKAWKGEIRNV